VTASEQNNSGFDIERKIFTGNWAKIGFVDGNGTVITPSNYSFINFEIRRDSKFNITVFDLVGRKIKTLVNEVAHTVKFDASGISSGLHFYRIMIDCDNKFVMTKKLNRINILTIATLEYLTVTTLERCNEKSHLVTTLQRSNPKRIKNNFFAILQ